MYSKSNPPIENEISVFRIEHNIHWNGVFTSSEILHSAIAKQINKSPSPFHDGCCINNRIPGYMVFGTTDIHTLLEWVCLFEDPNNNYFVIENLVSAGFLIREFKVKTSDIVFSISGRQVLFDPTEPRALKKYQNIEFREYVEEYILPVGECHISEIPNEWTLDGQLVCF